MHSYWEAAELITTHANEAPGAGINTAHAPISRLGIRFPTAGA